MLNRIEVNRGASTSSSYANSSFDQQRGEVGKFVMTFELDVHCLRSQFVAAVETTGQFQRRVTRPFWFGENVVLDEVNKCQ